MRMYNQESYKKQRTYNIFRLFNPNTVVGNWPLVPQLLMYLGKKLINLNNKTKNQLPMLSILEERKLGSS